MVLSKYFALGYFYALFILKAPNFSSFISLGGLKLLIMFTLIRRYVRGIVIYIFSRDM